MRGGLKENKKSVSLIVGVDRRKRISRRSVIYQNNENSDERRNWAMRSDAKAIRGGTKTMWAIKGAIRGDAKRCKEKQGDTRRIKGDTKAMQIDAKRCRGDAKAM
jgi:hypothetical protein